jgi:hypothetical protein
MTSTSVPHVTSGQYLRQAHHILNIALIFMPPDWLSIIAKLTAKAQTT